MNTIGPDGVEIYNSFEDEIIEVNIDGKISKEKVKKNVTNERYMFFKRDQDRSENIETYYAELRVLSKSCEFKDLRDSLIKDRLII